MPDFGGGAAEHVLEDRSTVSAAPGAQDLLLKGAEQGRSTSGDSRLPRIAGNSERINIHR